MSHGRGGYKTRKKTCQVNGPLSNPHTEPYKSVCLSGRNVRTLLPSLFTSRQVKFLKKKFIRHFKCLNKCLYNCFYYNFLNIWNFSYFYFHSKFCRNDEI